MASEIIKKSIVEIENKMNENEQIIKDLQDENVLLFQTLKELRSIR